MEDKIIDYKIIDSIIKCMPNDKCFLCHNDLPHPHIVTNPYPGESYEEIKERELKGCIESNLQELISVFFHN